MASNTPESAEFNNDRRKVPMAALLSAVVGAAGLAAGYAVLPRYFRFPESNSGSARLRAAGRHLRAALGAVRRWPGLAQSPTCQVLPAYASWLRRRFLQNTLEQAVLAIGMHLALATLLPLRCRISCWRGACWGPDRAESASHKVVSGRLPCSCSHYRS